MGFSFDGHVLRGARIAPSNAVTSGEPVTGVIRDPRSVPTAYTLKVGSPLGEPPTFVDAAADKYRAGILDAPGTTPVEYLVWAQNTASLSWVDDPSWWLETGTATYPTGTLSVTDVVAGETWTDGAAHLVVTDEGNRSLSRILAVVVARGDQDYDDDGWIDPDDVNPANHPGGQPRKGNAPYVTLYFEADEQSPTLGMAYLTDVQQTALAGGLSLRRGDYVVAVHYTLASSRFWWTRNDRYETRFGWDGQARRWAPYKGTAVKNLGAMVLDLDYTMSPKVNNLPVGTFLPGSSAAPDQYSMIRVGSVPGATGTPVGSVRVVADSDFEDYDFAANPCNAVMGQTGGKLAFNPEFATAHAGETIWYSYKGYSPTSDGIVGPMRLADATPLYLAPIPGPTDHPFIHFGSRNPLTPILVTTDAALASINTVDPGTVAVSLSTGKLRFAPEDVQRADPSTPLFDKYFLGEDVIYKGVALNSQPQPTRAPVALVDEAGAVATAQDDPLYIPDAVELPTEFALDDPRRGLGVSGILDAPDGTGGLPSQPGVAATVRPGGDTIGAQNLGRIRQVDDGVGESILFSREGAIITLEEVTLEADLPTMGFKVKASKAYVARERGVEGSLVVLGRSDRKSFGDNAVYFLQSSLTPATFTTDAVVYSRGRDIFRFTGDEVFYYAVDGTAYLWTPTLLLAAYPNNSYFTPEMVAASLQSDTLPLPPAGTATAVSGRVAIRGATSVEIGFGTDGEKDLSGCTALGLMPGWRAVNGVQNWLPDSGVTLGLPRSPSNMDRSSATPDYAAVDRVENIILSESVPPSPFTFLDNVPLQDIAGYDDGVFFTLQYLALNGDEIEVVNKPLLHYEDIIHRFGQRKFDWVEDSIALGVVDKTTTTLNLGVPSLVPETLLGIPEIAAGLLVAPDGGVYIFQDPDTDFVLPQDGVSGNVILVERFGSLVTYGSKGARLTDPTHFEDQSADFTQAKVGYRLKITSGDNTGSYLVEEILSSTQVRLAPAIPEESQIWMTWELFTGHTSDVYDPALVADMVYKDFQLLPEEPFIIRILHLAGLVPATPAEQEANRLQVDMGEAVELDRPISLRFGLEAVNLTNEATLTALRKVPMGTMANNLLTLPDVNSSRFSTEAFSVQVGRATFSHGAGDLVGVASFSSDPSGIEYLTADIVVGGVTTPKGRLKFGTTVLTSLTGAKVYYQEEFLGAALLVSGEAEFDPSDGWFNLSSADLTVHAGKRLYFVEQLETEGHRDVSINPMLGAFSPNVPLPRGAVVEVLYWRADLEGRRIGDQVVEFLPVFVRKEQAQLVAPNIYKFNHALEDTVFQDIEPSVWIGAMMQNFGQVDCVVDYPEDWNGAGRVTFVSKTVDATDPVTVTFAVYEAQGGERSYEASQKNIYRPPFFIKANQSRFGLRTDRTAEFEPGQMIRIGEDCFYIRSLKYFPLETDGSGDVTEVNIFPSTINEVGSRAPGNDLLNYITDKPLTTVVDPDGPTPVPTTAAAGFMSAIDLTQFPFESVVRGQKVVIFRGDLTEFAVPGHVIEIGGAPYTIGSSEITEDGTRTKITVTGSFHRAFDILAAPIVKISYRPVYPPNFMEFVGVGPVLDSETVELVLFGETLSNGEEAPGRTLVPDVEYHLDYTSGAVQLLWPPQAGLQPNQWLLLTFTKLRTLQPYLKDEVLVEPRFQASFLSVTTPSEANDRLGATLAATFTFSSPDSFYFRAVELTQFLSEAAQEAIRDINATSPAGGSIQISAGGTDNWQQGRFGLMGEKAHLSDLDRAARTFLGFYNDTVVAFEQIQETISGGFVGDRDGKFRFWVGYGKDYPTPGYEDAISGGLLSRFVWADAVNSERVLGAPAFLTLDDWVVAPDSVTLEDAEISGSFLGPNTLNIMQTIQGALVQNDVDDVVLLKLGKTHITGTGADPYYHFKAKGVFGRMSDQHQFSRIFPTRTKAFFRLYPGAGAQMEPGAFNPGVYTAGRDINGEWLKTTGEQIGQISNPVLGDIQGVDSIDLVERRARGRIWGYFPDGLPGGLFDGGASPPVPVACIIVTPLLLRDVPVDPETGYPDDTRFLSTVPPGDLGDAVAGDPELAVPGFEAGDQLGWGKPDGTELGAFCPTTVLMWGATEPTGLFVREVLYGCVITFQDYLAAPMALPEEVLVVDTPAHEYPLERGDTLMVVSPSGVAMQAPQVPDLTTAPTFQTFADSTVLAGLYRDGYDLGTKSDGQVIDKSLPSLQDHAYIPLKELAGQNVPEPTSSVEGILEFLYMNQNPLKVPALLGGWVDDSGDFSVPYIRTGNTEIDRFEDISVVVSEAISARSDTVPTEAVYPDEILSLNGVVNVVGDTPASLDVDADLFPVVPGPIVPGIGNARPYDLILVQEPALFEDSDFTTLAGYTLGPHGILSIGRAETIPGGTAVEPPRFVTHTAAPPAGLSPVTGDAVRYNLTNAMVFVDGIYPPDPQVGVPPAGVAVFEDTLAGITVLDFTSVPMALNDGITRGVGNLNDVYFAGNPITIRMIARPDPNVVAGPVGPNPLPSLTGGVEALRITLWQGMAFVWTYQDDFNLAPPIGVALGGPPIFGDNVVPVLPVSDNRQIIIPGLGIIPWGAVPPNTWFLPHTLTPGPLYTMIYGFEYSFDIDARGFLHWAPAAPIWGSLTAWVDEDRLTFHETCDLRYASERGFVHPLNPALDLETQLTVDEVRLGRDAATWYWSDVNARANGWTGAPIPFTFLMRVPPYVGEWQMAAGTVSERGSIRVMAFEGHDNVPIEGVTVASATVPSCDYPPNQTAEICSGVGVTSSRLNTWLTPAEVESSDCRLTAITPSSGSVGAVEKGDVLVINGSSNLTYPGTLYAGTYLVRHAVETLGGSYRAVAPTSTTGVGTGWCPVVYPTVLGYDNVTNELTVSDLAPAAGGPLVGGVNVGFPLPAAGTRVFVLISPAGLASFDELTFRGSVISAEYSGMAMVAGRGVFTVANWQDAMGTVITEAEFELSATVGTKISGMQFLPVQVSGAEYGLPHDNCVGVDDAALSIYGFRRLTFRPPTSLTHFPAAPDNAQPVVFNSAGAPGVTDGALDRVAGFNTLIPMVSAPEPGHEFLPSPATPVYHWVAHTLDVQAFNSLLQLWDTLNVAGGSYGGIHGATGVRCILPGTEMAMTSENVGVMLPGFRAQAGIFLEPSVPRAGLDLVPAVSHVRVVDQDHSLPDPTLAATDDVREIWMRNAHDYYLGGGASTQPNIPEEVTFIVRRIRRFHNVGGSPTNLMPLRYAYEIRRGMITDYTVMPSQMCIVQANSFTMNWESIKPAGSPKANDAWNDGATYLGTNLGPFNNEDVNAHAGDTFRLLDRFGDVVEEAEISSVREGHELVLVPPGLQLYDPSNGTVRFEIFLRHAPVPHEQTNEQLLDVITSRAVTRTDATWGVASELGGYVPEVTGGATYAGNVNKLYDDLNAPGTGGQTFGALGVQKGDIVVVDPIGLIPQNLAGDPTTQELAMRPVGDDSVDVRIGAGVYVPGRPNPLDDNRGFYRVLQVVDSVTPPYLLVNPVTEFTGTDVAPVVFDPTDDTRAYAVYPSIHDSSLAATGEEGQMDLRPTRARNPANGSFKNYPSGLSNHSVRPFSYQVIRPTQFFTDATIDLVLSTRERMLSLIALINQIGHTKGGSYFIFQRDTHLYDVGSPTDPELGLGVASNDYLMSVVGRVDVMPYANNTTCLSLLDRRFWILDEKLDFLTYDAASGTGMRRAGPGDTPYTEYSTVTGSMVRPVLPDLVDDVLDQSERLRDVRYVWLAYRTHQVLGTLASLSRFDAELPKRLQEQEQYLLLKESMEKVSET